MTAAIPAWSCYVAHNAVGSGFNMVVNFRNSVMFGLRKSLLLLGAFSIGYNAHAVLHELGHALAMWAIGGSVARITLNPFSWSYTYYGSAPTHPLFTAWAGVAFSSTVGLLLLASIRTCRHVWTVPLAITGICALVVNGVYLTVDSIFLAGGDATLIVDENMPRLFVLSVGIGLIALGLVVWHIQLPRIGLATADGALARIAILEGGIAPYLIAMLVYQVCWNQDEIVLGLAYVITGLTILAGVAVGSRFVDNWQIPRHRDPVIEPSWSIAVGFLVAGVIVVAMEILVCA